MFSNHETEASFIKNQTRFFLSRITLKHRNCVSDQRDGINKEGAELFAFISCVGHDIAKSLKRNA